MIRPYLPKPDRAKKGAVSREAWTLDPGSLSTVTQYMKKQNIHPMYKALPTLLLLILALSACTSGQQGKHLFILSGQSNMARLDPAETFTPALEKAFGEDQVVVVKFAQGARPIHRWYRNWQAPAGDSTVGNPDLYDSLMTRVMPVIEQEPIATITFLWMQGERDARMGWGDQYERSLRGLYDQLSDDLDRDDIHFVIGRLSDFDLTNQRYPHWTKVREAQVRVAGSNARFGWINTDNLNEGINSRGDTISNDLHMSVEGYRIMGKHFAEKAIQLIGENK